MIRQLKSATLNAYWDYDPPFPASPTQYVRRSDLAFVSGPAESLLGTAYGPGQCVFFQAPAGRMDDPAARRLKLALNTCGFYISYGNVNEGHSGFWSAYNFTAQINSASPPTLGRFYKFRTVATRPFRH